MKKLFKLLVLATTLLTSINAFAQPLQADGGGSQTICNGQTATLGGSPSAQFGTPPYTYSWAPAGALIDPTASNPTTFVLPAGSTTFTLTVTDNVAAVATNTLTVTVNPAPVIDPIPDYTTCEGATFGPISFSSDIAGTSFSWTNSNTAIGLGSAGSTSSIGFTAQNGGATQITGTITVTGTVGACSSVSPETFDIYVNPPQDASFSYSAGSFCQGNPANEFPALSPGATAGTFTSAPAGLSMDAAGMINFAASTPGSYTITNTVPAGGGCPGTSAMYGINIIASPTITAVGPTVFTCVGSSVNFTSSGSGGVSYLWNFDDAGTATTANATHVYSTAGTYHASIQSTAASGCVSAIDTQMVYVYPLPVISSVTSTDVTCNGFCNGTATVVASGTALTYYWPGFPSTSSSPSGLCPGSSTVEITDANACVAIGSLTTISEPPPLINTTSGTVQSCPGDSAQLWASGSGGVPPYYYTWDSGSGAVIMPDTIMAWGPISYTVTVRDANNCAGSSNAGASVIPYTDISGHVTTTSGTLSTGTNTAVLYLHMPFYASMDSVMVDTIDASGNFLFPALAGDDYIVKVFPDAAAYPLVMPTYSQDQPLWDMALVINHSCFFPSTANVTMVETTPPSGFGSLSGSVQAGDGFGRAPGDPVPGIDVKLGRNPGGQMIAQTETDGSGDYSFSNLPLSSGDYYTIYVDIPGLERDSVYNITLTSGTSTYTNLDYIADSNSVYPIYPTSVSVKDPGLNTDVQFMIYPNPTNAGTTVSYALQSDAQVKLEVYDVLGKQVESLVNANQPGGTYKVNQPKLKAGVYFVTLNINNNTSTTRLVVIE